MTRPCDGPASAPDRRLTQHEVEQLLATNTAALIVCRDRLTGLVAFISKRDKGITGK